MAINKTMLRSWAISCIAFGFSMSFSSYGKAGEDVVREAVETVHQALETLPKSPEDPSATTNVTLPDLIEKNLPEAASFERWHFVDREALIEIIEKASNSSGEGDFFNQNNPVNTEEDYLKRKQFMLKRFFGKVTFGVEAEPDPDCTRKRCDMMYRGYITFPGYDSDIDTFIRDESSVRVYADWRVSLRPTESLSASDYSKALEDAQALFKAEEFRIRAASLKRRYNKNPAKRKLDE